MGAINSVIQNNNASSGNFSKKSNNMFGSLAQTIKDVFFYAWSGFNIVLINPFRASYNSTAKSLDAAYRGALKPKVKKEEQIKETSFERMWKNTSFYKKEQEALQKEKEEFMAILNSEQGTKRSEKPVTYRYKVKDEKGRVIQDTFIGVSMADCNAFLVNAGYDVISIKTSKQIEFLYGRNGFIGVKKLSTKDLIFWLTQLSTYIKSGIPLTDSMRIMAKQMGKEAYKRRLFDSIVYELTLGESFSSALEKQGNAIPPLLINMLKAAEATGELEETLDDMANYYDEIDKTRRQMISAMTYPVLISIFAFGVIAFIMMYVVPQFVQIYESTGVEISGLTLFVINTANFLKYNIINIILFAVITVIIFIILYKNLKAFKREIQVLLMHIPVIKNVIIYNELTIFTKTFASLLKNNVFITESIDILSRITENEIYKEVMYETINNIALGEKISESFKNHWAVPDVAYYMIVTGESTGELATMMDRVSKYYQDMHKNIITSLKAFIEPIMIVVLAVIVGAVILAVIIPMFDMYSQISM